MLSVCHSGPGNPRGWVMASWVWRQGSVCGAHRVWNTGLSGPVRSAWGSCFLVSLKVGGVFGVSRTVAREWSLACLNVVNCGASGFVPFCSALAGSSAIGEAEKSLKFSHASFELFKHGKKRRNWLLLILLYIRPATRTEKGTIADAFLWICSLYKASFVGSYFHKTDFRVFFFLCRS